MGYKKWTNEEIQQATELYNNGKSCSEISEILNRKPDGIGVWNKLKKIGVIKVEKSKSLWDIVELRPYVNEEEAKKTTSRNNKKVLATCKKCNTVKRLRARCLTIYGMSCACSKGTSYPELFFQAYLNTKGIKYETQVKFEDSQRRIDFKIKINNTLYFVECNGLQHYQEQTSEAWKDVHSKTKASDKIKRVYSKSVGTELIELDCRESTFEFIKNSIEQCEYLPNIIDDEVAVMLDIIEQNKRYPMKEIKKLYVEDGLTLDEIGAKLNMKTAPIYKVLKMHNIDLRNSGHPQRMVRLIETNRVFNSMKDAEKQTGVKNTSISKCVNGKVKSAGKLSTGDKAHWEFVSEEEIRLNEKIKSLDVTTEINLTEINI